MRFVHPVHDRSSDFPSEQSHRLFSAIFGDVSEEHPLVSLVLDDQLQDLSVNALITANWNPALSVGQQAWLDKRYTVIVLPGSRTLELRRHEQSDSGQRLAAATGTFAVGAPLLSVDSKCGLPNDAPPDPSDVSAVAARVARLCKLVEADEILVKLHATKSVVGGDATLGGFRTAAASGELSRAATIIFATHGLTASEMAALSGSAEPALVLTPKADADVPEDGLLRAREIAGLQLSAELVVLIACDSGARAQADATSYRGTRRCISYSGCAFTTGRRMGD